MKRVALVAVLALVLILSISSVAFAEVNSVTPSTNEINKTYTPAWAHFNIADQGPGYVELEFVSERAFWSCFEYRTNGDISQIVETNGGVNWNTDITDGLYPSTCENNSSSTMTFDMPEGGYVEVRMVFGGETNERFDWTRVDIAPLPALAQKITGGGWIGYGDDMVNFGFVVQDKGDKGIFGNVNVVMKTADGTMLHLKADTIDEYYADVNGVYNIKGASGTVNGEDGYAWRILGEGDSFGIRIWKGGLVYSTIGMSYDPASAATLGGGKIQVH